MTTGAPSSLGARLARTAFLLLAVLACTALIACGGEDPAETEQEVEEVALAYGASEGEEACDFLSASALDQLGGESGCAQQFGAVGAAEFEVEDVVVEGETATAEVRNVETDTVITLEFVTEDDEWKISAFPGLGDLAPTPPEDEPPPGESEEPPPEGEGEAPSEDEPAADDPPEEEQEPPADEPDAEPPAEEAP